MALRPDPDLHVGACNADGNLSSRCPPIIALLAEAATAARHFTGAAFCATAAP